MAAGEDSGAYAACARCGEETRIPLRRPPLVLAYHADCAPADNERRGWERLLVGGKV